MDPYTTGLVTKDAFFKKRPVEGRIVAVLANRYDRRNLSLIPQLSRAVLKNEIHELMLTDEGVSPGDTINRICCLCFFEITAPGIIVRGDRLLVSGKDMGTVLGFNGDHMPNHLNIVVNGAEQKTGAELEIDLDETLILRKTQE